MSKLFAAIMVLLIKTYGYFISPMFPPSCRYIPTCSAYAIDAIKHHGCIRGIALSVIRLLKCHPFCGHGLDQIKRK